MAIASLIISIFALVVAVIGAIIAGHQAKSARLQATEAKKQTRTAQAAAQSAEEQARSAEAQLAEMVRQTDATLATLEPRLELVVVRLPGTLDRSDPRLTLRTPATWEWRIVNHGGAAALDVKVALNFDLDGTEHGEMRLGGVGAGETRVLTSRYQRRLPSYPDARDILGDQDPVASVTYTTIRNELTVDALTAVTRDEAQR